MTTKAEQQSSAPRKPNKNCKRCWGRGTVTLILAKDPVTGEEVKEQKPCSCTWPCEKGRKQ